jgi:hypothetical protein
MMPYKAARGRDKVKKRRRRNIDVFRKSMKNEDLLVEIKTNILLI